MDMAVGTFGVVTTSNGGHDLDFYADRIVERLISVSETAPEPIKAQALHYKNSLRLVVRDGLERAVRSDRTTLVAKMERAGLADAALFIKHGG